jgi:sialate O-acetylesterase
LSDVPDTPQDNADGAWQVSSPGSVKEFSAVAYYFAREIQAGRKVPVGVIQSARGGTPVEAWMSRGAIERVPAFAPVLANWDRVQREYPELHRKHEEWRVAAARARAEGTPVPREPLMGGRPGQKNTPSGLYNCMIAPVTPYTIRGVIWYQGESNVNGVQYEWTTSFHDLYHALFPALIADWRRAWGVGNFPFLFVQLANFGETRPAGTASAWAEVREAQLKALSVPKTGMAVAIEIGEPRDIHPRNKQEVSRRLALAARAIAYGERVAHTGPRLKKANIKGQQVWLDFETAGGLAARGDRLTGFTVAGQDRRFVEAEARIEGKRIAVSSPAVAQPVAVRYGWADNPACNLYDGTNLPASPFRTDDWPLDTEPATR